MTQKEIETRLINLEKAFIQSQQNIEPTVEKTYKNANSIENITPYMDSARAYIGDTFVSFIGVREGNISAYLETDSGRILPTIVCRNGSDVTVEFEVLEEVATVTISVL